MVKIPLGEVKDFHRNKRAMLQRLAKRCQSCPSVLKYVIYEYLVSTETWLKEMGEKYAEGSGSSSESDR